jgi:extradiol dioxygenase family protein
MHEAGAVLFAKDLGALAGFYERVAGLRRGRSDDDHVVLGFEVFRLVVHAIPPHIASGIEITAPPVVRDDTPNKLAYRVG